ncbi:histidine kinase [Lentzea sp. NPDC042327]|uniref:sensor histidine kinase n=1 Tax=Lentzea sp. NPDC042327 TaxID=3154801 RepID=UPI0033E494B5
MNVRLRDGLWAGGALLLALMSLMTPLGRPAAPWLVVASAVWAAAVVPVSARWPRAALLLTTPLHAVNNLLAIAPTSLVVFRVARTVPARQLWLLVPATAALQAGFGGLHSWLNGDNVTEYLLGTGFSVVFLLVFPAVAGALVGRRKPLTQVLMERNDYLEHARVLTASTARSDTRAHIASEMHDVLSHRLRQLTAHAGALEAAAAEQAPELREQVELIRKTSAVAMDELREILGVLGTATETGEDAGTRADVERLVAASQDAGVSVHLRWTGDDLADADARLRRAVHRVVREALTNVHKHAPSAQTRVSVHVAERVRVEVVNGPSGEPRGGGTRRGLIGLEERVTLIGGQFDAGRLAGGFRVAADLPAHPVVQEETGATGAVAEAPPPVTADVLTVPRVVGSGCLGVLAVVPAVGTVLVLVVIAVFGRGEMTRQEFDGYRVAVTHEAEVTETHGFGVPADGPGCYRYPVRDDDGHDFELCFTRQGLLTTKRELAR